MWKITLYFQILIYYQWNPIFKSIINFNFRQNQMQTHYWSTAASLWMGKETLSLLQSGSKFTLFSKYQDKPSFPNIKIKAPFQISRKKLLSKYQDKPSFPNIKLNTPFQISRKILFSKYQDEPSFPNIKINTPFQISR